MRKEIKQYDIYGDFYVTKNLREGTCSIYNKNKELLRTVNDSELETEIELLESDQGVD